MENLSADGALTNVVSLSGPFVIHSKEIDISCPCILFAATDGCFGYLSSPMEFENMLLNTLLSSESIEDWENKIAVFLNGVSGDDFSLCGLIIGYGSFNTLKMNFAEREKKLCAEYIDDIATKSLEEKRHLWKKYSSTYSRYLTTI